MKTKTIKESKIKGDLIFDGKIIFKSACVVTGMAGIPTINGNSKCFSG